MKKIIKVLLVITVLFINSPVFADVNLTVRNGENVVFSGSLAIPTATTSVNDSSGTPHTIDASSVLAALENAGQTSGKFSVSNLTYYGSFTPPSLYLKCITIADSGAEKCDNWQYVVNNSSPFDSIDQKILSGTESVYVYFGPQNKIVLSSNNINTNNTLTVTSQKYDYNNNQWVTRVGATVGLTQTNPDDPWSPIEVITKTVDENGQVVFSTILAGSYNIGIKEDGYFPTEILTVVTAPPIMRGGGGGALATILSSPPTPTIKQSFNIEKAFKFIISKQKENGSFGEDLYTDWSAISLATIENYSSQKIKLVKYFSKNLFKGTLLTDYERHSMALMTLGLSPYNTNSENYIKKIIKNFDGKQFGDIKEDNDDIFALIVLQNAGYTKEEEIIKNVIAYIISKQKENGSWDESVDMTGAGIGTLSSFNQEEQIKDSLGKAREFLKQKQKENGGWGNVSSTAWAIEGILALSERPEDWVKNGNTPLNYLAENQDIDGGMKNEYLQNKIWETAYVVTALSGKTWNQIMQKFEKPKEIKGQSLESFPRTVLENPKVSKSKIEKEAKEIKQIVNPENLLLQNTATVINSLETETPKSISKSWFRKLLDKILSIF